jgi:hypothetical protein
LFDRLGPMSKITLIAIAALCLSVVSVLLLIWFSPEGDEDGKGFHPGLGDESHGAQADDNSKVQSQNVASSKSATSITAKR